MDFQTPDMVCEYMVSLLSKDAYDLVLEPTPGVGNLSRAVKVKANNVIEPADYFKMDINLRFDAVVMNPPFTPMELGYKILFECLDRTDELVSLMPWLTIINSNKRTEKLFGYGLQSVTHLPRSIFKGSRVQCCVLHLLKGAKQTNFYNYNRHKILA
jgi:hypothetical protein